MTIVRTRGPRSIHPVPDRLPEDLRSILEDLRTTALATLSGDVARSQVASGIIAGGPALGGDSEGDTDLTPPPSPFDVVVGAGPDFVGIVTGNPAFTAGNGYGRTVVYGAKYPGTGPLPTFAAAAIVHEFVGQVGSFATEPGTQWHIWVDWRTRDGVLSGVPVGGVNGFVAITGTNMDSFKGALSVGAAWITNAMVVNLSASKILAGSIAVGEYIQSSGFVPGSTAGFRIDGSGGVEARTVGGARIFNLNASGAAPVLKIDSAFQITGAGALTLSGALTASSFTGGTITGALIQTATSGKRVIINESSSNEARFYGDRGDGTVERLASIGIATSGPDTVIGLFGSLNSSRVALQGETSNQIAVAGYTNAGNIAVYGKLGNSSPSFGAAVWGESGTTGSGALASGVRGISTGGFGVYGSSDSGQGVQGTSTSGHGGAFAGNATRSALFLTPVTVLPATGTVGSVILYNTTALGNVLCWYSNNGPGGAGWYGPSSIALV